MKGKKLLALLLCLAMVAGVLSACGSTAAPSAAPEAAASGAEEAAAPAEEGAAPAEEAAEAPAAEEAAASAEEAGSAAEEAPAEEAPAEAGGLITTDYTYDLPLFPDDPDFTFSMWVSFSDNASNYMPNQYADNRAFQKACEMTGVNVDMVCISTSSNSEQFQLRVASNDLPNVITNVAQLWTGSYDAAIDDEVFIDLTDMIENYMPAYKECYDQLPDSVKLDLHTDGGNIPRLISINNYPQGAGEGLFVRTDYLEKVGKDIPETYDELEDVLYAFQSELGLSESLMAVAGLVHTSNALVSGLGVWGGFSTFPFNTDPYYCVDGKVKYGIIEDGYHEYMEMFHKWYADGIISPDFISKNQNPMEFAGTIGSGNTGVFFGETNIVPSYYSVGQSNDPDFEITPVPPITKTEGEATHFGTSKSPISGRLAGIAVTTTPVDLEKLGTYLDFFFTEEGALLSAMGVEETADQEGSYIWDENGELAYSDTWNNSELNEMEKPTYWIYSVVPMLCPKTPTTYYYDVQYECADVWDLNADDAWKLPDVKLNADEQYECDAIYADIRTVVEENLTKFAVGDRDMAEWDDFIDQLYDLGIEDCIALYQQAVDRYYAR